jgi:hypothetical protein
VATTHDAIVDRVRSLLVAAPFLWTEAISSEAFTFQGTGTGDQVFRVKARGGAVRGGTGYSEERTDSLEIEVIRLVNADYDGTRRSLFRDGNSLVAAIIRDGHETSGDYAVPDTGRTHDVIGSPGAAYLTLRVTVPINYEFQA